MSLADELKAQMERDRQKWEALSPTMRKSFENELAAIWPNFPQTERKEPAECEHDWEYTRTDYHGSHKGEDHYKCRKCGEREYRND